MLNTLTRTLLFITANALMIAGIVLGYGYLFDKSLFLALSTITTVSEFLIQARISILGILSQDPGYLFGILFCFGVIVYDIKFISHWLFSFSFAREKKCRSCSQKMYREQRVFLDRILSFFVSVKRYRCIGCGKEYLLRNKHAEQHVPDFNAAAEKVVK